MTETEHGFRAAMQIKRSDIFGLHDEQMPEIEQADAMIPQIGYIGRRYSPGGNMLLAINPGGGGRAYRKTAEDAALLPKIERFRRDGSDLKLLHEISEHYAANMRTWNLWRIVKPVLDACGLSQEDVVYLNWCPFRTREDAMPRAAAMRRSHDSLVRPAIETLRPKRVIALGKKVGGWLDRTSLDGVQTFVVARTNGDRYVCEEARRTLDLIRASRNPVK